MSSTSDREQQDEATPATTPATEADAPAPSGSAPAGGAPADDAAAATGSTDAPAADGSTAPAPAAPSPTTPATTTEPPASSTPSTPGRGTSAHRAVRRSPVPPPPEEPRPSVVPTTATVSDGTGAPTAPLPTTTDPLGADPDPTEPTEPPAEVRRTSFRGAEARAAAVLLAGTTPPPATPGAGITTTDAPLPGTGPSDASVPYGDPSAPATPREPLPAVPPGGLAQHPAPDATPAPAPVRRPGGGVGRHLLGALVGVLLGAVGVWTVVFGQSKVLAAQAPGWDTSYDPLGVVLVTAGVLVLAVVLGLGLWTPSVPITAGGVAAVVGAAMLYVPATTHVDVVRWVATEGTEYTVVRATVTATSGSVFVVGALLLVAGLVLARARRRWLPRV